MWEEDGTRIGLQANYKASKLYQVYVFLPPVGGGSFPLPTALGKICKTALATKTISWVKMLMKLGFKAYIG